MERRKAAAIAGAASLTLVAGVLALGANLGLFGLGHDDSRVGSYPVTERSVVPAPGAVPVAGQQGTGTLIPTGSRSVVGDDHEKSDDHDSEHEKAEHDDHDREDRGHDQGKSHDDDD